MSSQTSVDHRETVGAELSKSDRKLSFLSVRVSFYRENPYICPIAKVGNQIIIGWENVIKLLDELKPTTHIRHQQIIRRLYELKKSLTTRQMLAHPEASKLLLELVELNRRDMRKRWIEHLIYCESLHTDRSLTEV